MKYLIIKTFIVTSKLTILLTTMLVELFISGLTRSTPPDIRGFFFKRSKLQYEKHYQGKQRRFSFRSENKKPTGAFILSFDEITNQQIDFLRSIGMIQIPKTNKWRQSEAMAKIVTVKASNNADFKFKVGVVKKLGYRWNADDKVWAFDWAGSQGLA